MCDVRRFEVSYERLGEPVENGKIIRSDAGLLEMHNNDFKLFKTFILL